MFGEMTAERWSEMEISLRFNLINEMITMQVCKIKAVHLHVKLTVSAILGIIKCLTCGQVCIWLLAFTY